MNTYYIVFSVASAIILFLFGLRSFSAELRSAAGVQLQEIMRRLTVNRFIAFFVGLVFTALIQSSAAVTSLAVALVDARVLSFAGAMAIMLGAYVGTTATAWLVSLKLMGIGPFFIVIGTLISMLPIKAKVFGKALFYFGFIFFSLDLISATLGPMKDEPYFKDLLIHTDTPLKGIATGILMTVLLQSSAVVTGLAIILVQQEMLLPAASIPIVLGANIGTTATALFAAVRMGKTARKAAISNSAVNIIGVCVFFPFLNPFSEWALALAPTPAMVVAIAHLGFNLVLVSFLLVFLTPFVRVMDRLFDDADEANPAS